MHYRQIDHYQRQAKRRAHCSIGPQIFCSNTHSSMGILAFGDTSHPPPRRLERWEICLPPWSIQTSERGRSLPWRARLRRRRYDGSPRCLATGQIVEACLLSGGNMANLVCVLAARQAKAGWDVRKEGLKKDPLRIYCSSETHTWIQKAADIAGLGTDAIRWIAANRQMQMDLSALREQIVLDLAAGDRPFLVIGTAGTVGTGAVDPLCEMAMICREFNLWFHVDGAYGALAVRAKDPPPERSILTSGCTRHRRLAAP